MYVSHLKIKIRPNQLRHLFCPDWVHPHDVNLSFHTLGEKLICRNLTSRFLSYEIWFFMYWVNCVHYAFSLPKDISFHKTSLFVWQHAACMNRGNICVLLACVRALRRVSRMHKCFLLIFHVLCNNTIKFNYINTI